MHIHPFQNPNAHKVYFSNLPAYTLFFIHFMEIKPTKNLDFAMSQLCKILTLFALIMPLALPIQAQLELASAPVDQTQNDDILYYAPSPYGEDMSPESQYPLDDMASELEDQYPSSPPAYAPAIEEDYPYNGEYHSPSPAPYIDVLAPEVEDFYDSLSEAPSLTETELLYSGPSETPIGGIMAAPPVIEFDYGAEDDAGDFSSEDEDEEGYGEKKKKAGALGFVIGAVCLVGLGGLVYQRRKNQKRKHPVYMGLSKSGEV